MGEGQWYTNKDLFMIIQELTTNLADTNAKIKKYNGLREDLRKCQEGMQEMRATVKLMIWGLGIVGSGVLVALVSNVLRLAGL